MQVCIIIFVIVVIINFEGEEFRSSTPSSSPSTGDVIAPNAGPIDAAEEYGDGGGREPDGAEEEDVGGASLTYLHRRPVFEEAAAEQGRRTTMTTLRIRARNMTRMPLSPLMMMKRNG